MNSRVEKSALDNKIFEHQHIHIRSEVTVQRFFG